MLSIPPATVISAAYSLAVLAGCYLVAWLLLDEAMLHGGAGFELAIVYTAASLGGAATRRLKLPPLIGMLIAGLALKNIPGALTADHPLLGHSFTWWSKQVRAGALATIMLRAGLGLDLQKLRRFGFVTARLACLPCLTEALVVGLLAAAASEKSQ